MTHKDLTVRKYLALALVQLLILAGCGGGGGGYGGSSSGGSSSGGSSGTSSSGGQVIASPGPPNVEPITASAGPAGVNAVNTPYVTVQICVPGTQTCQTLDNVQIDTGSTGLRVLASALTITLPNAKDAGGHVMAECLAFADGASWGPLATLDLTLPTSNEAAAGVTVQVIGDPTYESNRPATCPTPSFDTVTTFGANGILGVGPFAQDCGTFCVSSIPSPAQYYGCPTPSTCAGETVPVAAQVQNPGTLFGADSNGVIVELPAASTSGSTNLAGSLVFGINTETNNTIPSGVTVMTADSTFAFVTAKYNNTDYPDSYFDSGSNGVFFTSSATQCGAAEQGFYCPSSDINIAATVTGTNNQTANAPFTVSNAATLFQNNQSATAFPNLGGVNSDPQSVDFGLSFFFGHNVYTAFEGASVSGVGNGPFYAY